MVCELIGGFYVCIDWILVNIVCDCFVFTGTFEVDGVLSS